MRERCLDRSLSCLAVPHAVPRAGDGTFPLVPFLGLEPGTFASGVVCYDG